MNDRGLSRKHVMESINGSLRRLQTDYVDVYQAHRYDYETPLPETMGAFADIVHAGKAHYIGVSEWTMEEIRAGAALASELGIQLVSGQPQYNMLWRVIEAEVVPVCQELGLSQVCWSPLAQGVLTGKYDGGRSVPRASRFTSDDGELKTEHKFMQHEVLERVEKLKPIAEDLGGRLLIGSTAHWATSLSGTPPKSNPSRSAPNGSLRGPGLGPGYAYSRGSRHLGGHWRRARFPGN